MTLPISANRRGVLGAGAATLAAGLLPAPLSQAAPAWSDRDVAPFRTPYKYGRLILEGVGGESAFDSRKVDCPFVFSAEGRLYMTYVGFDGTGYQTGLATSDDLVNWRRVKLILPRDPNSTYARYNLAMMCILRDDALTSDAPLKKVDGRYVGAWHAYPDAGYESGPAVIGLAWSEDLLHWRVDPPILFPQDGAAWERGGLYKPYLLHEDGVYYLFYNAKTADRRWVEQTGLATSRDLKTWTRYPGNPILTAGPAGSLDDRFASDPCVVRHKGLWAMYYYGLSSRDGKARELLALGRDPHHFTKVDEVMIDVGPPGSIDSVYAHKPSVITYKGDLYHFYCAVSGKWPDETRGVSVARSRPW